MDDDKSSSNDINKKLDQARLAMEGLERTEKRLEEERKQTTQKEQEEIKSKLAELDKNKEVLELDWVKLDDQRQLIKNALKPILEAEKQAEDAEATIELEEAKTTTPQEKTVIEKKRWEAQDKRRQAEKEKWDLQAKLWKIEETIQINTKKYRELLDTEDKLRTRAQELAIINSPNL